MDQYYSISVDYKISVSNKCVHIVKHVMIMFFDITDYYSNDIARYPQCL